ncbi:unnamed protein product [Vicia faba]|uniref:Uncharacterized protein n=1 Tax=Vicia faba TaxID=3906 RepID=A0AAV0ZDC9_VICFA|nr:unnamed protein product [Vicia faba]
MGLQIVAHRSNFSCASNPRSNIITSIYTAESSSPSHCDSHSICLFFFIFFISRTHKAILYREEGCNKKIDTFALECAIAAIATLNRRSLLAGYCEIFFVLCRNCLIYMDGMSHW